MMPQSAAAWFLGHGESLDRGIAFVDPAFPGHVAPGAGKIDTKEYPFPSDWPKPQDLVGSWHHLVATFRNGVDCTMWIDHKHKYTYRPSNTGGLPTMQVGASKPTG